MGVTKLTPCVHHNMFYFPLGQTGRLHYPVSLAGGWGHVTGLCPMGCGWNGVGHFKASTLKLLL